MRVDRSVTGAVLLAVSAHRTAPAHRRVKPGRHSAVKHQDRSGIGAWTRARDIFLGGMTAGAELGILKPDMNAGSFQNQHGFTLLEIIAVLVILSVIASIAINRFDFLSETASSKVLEAGIKELNIRETVVWAKVKLSDDGWNDDETLFARIDTNLGAYYTWNPKPDEKGGTLFFSNKFALLTRTASTKKSAGIWK